MNSSKGEVSLIVALDVGTAKTMFVAAELREGELHITGYGIEKAPLIRKGVVKGVVANTDTVTRSIERALGQLGLMVDDKFSSVYTAVSGEHIEIKSGRGMVEIKSGEITQSDIARVINSARLVSSQSDMMWFEDYVQEYIINAGQVVKDEPLGMSANKLEVKVHLVYGAQTAIENLSKCIRGCNGVENISGVAINLSILMSALAVLKDDEKFLGVCLLDIGAGTTDIVVFKDGKVKFAKVLPIAGDQITKDLAIFCHTSIATAEDLKVQHGCALSRLSSEHNLVEALGVDGKEQREYTERELAHVIEPRVCELLELVRDELRNNAMVNPEDLVGVVITGGGAKLRGIKEAAEVVLNVRHVRIGTTDNYKGNMKDVVAEPEFATSVGLLLHGQSELERNLHREKKAGVVGWVKHKLLSSF